MAGKYTSAPVVCGQTPFAQRKLHVSAATIANNHFSHRLSYCASFQTALVQN